MAWIKMRTDLADDPAVVSMAARLNITEDEVVGKLHKLWSWADRHTTDGTAPGITAAWVNRYVGSGFAEAMEAVNWVAFSPEGIEFPNFERHNGASAKRRGEDAIRQRLSREKRDKGVTGLTREAIPKSFVSYVFERDGFCCVYCGDESSAAIERSAKAKLTIDHIIPTTRGGSTKVPNLACACKACNAEKNDRTPEEWGMQPRFLQDGVTYESGTGMSQKKCDERVTRGDKRRGDKKPPKAPQGALVVPDWVPAEPWSEFVAMRRAKGSRNPFTVGAAKGIVAKLDGFRAEGYDLAEVLAQSTRNGWSDVFEPKVKAGAAQRQESFV